jgi:poly(U)-specific endoribonuclease
MGICQSLLGDTTQEPVNSKSFSNDNKPVINELQGEVEEEEFELQTQSAEKRSRKYNNKKPNNTRRNNPWQNKKKPVSKWANHNIASGSKAWPILNQIFVERLSFIRSMKAQKKVPTVAQLVTFLRNLENQIKNALHNNVERSVEETLQSEFNISVHWDWVLNKPVPNTSPPTPQFVENFLAKLVRISTSSHQAVRKKLSNSSNFVPTQSELNSLDEACSRLWLFDEKNRLNPGQDYAINLQQGKKPYQPGDRAPDNLFTYVQENVLKRKTFKLFIALLDNYSNQTGVAERVTSEEVSEEKMFMDACFETPIFQYVYRYIIKRKKYTGSIIKFQQYVHDLWFGLYKREARGDSSAFEHVFVGEIRDGSAIGMHNWIQLYSEEQKNRFDYLGFIKPKGMPRGYDSPMSHNDSRLVTVQFEWDGAIKPVSTSFIGTTPEFELGLYTLVYFCGNDGDNIISLGPYNVNLVCHKFGRGKYAHIGTVYPEALPMDTDAAATRVQAVFRGRRVRNNRR